MVVSKLEINVTKISFKLFEYVRVHDVSYLAILNIRIFKRIGDIYSLFGLLYIPKKKG